MVVMAAALIANRCANFLGERVQIVKQIINGFSCQPGSFGDGFVQICDISGMMFAVMNFHRLRIDVRFERIFWIRKRR